MGRLCKLIMIALTLLFTANSDAWAWGSNLGGNASATMSSSGGVSSGSFNAGRSSMTTVSAASRQAISLGGSSTTTYSGTQSTSVSAPTSSNRFTMPTYSTSNTVSGQQPLSSPAEQVQTYLNQNANTQNNPLAQTYQTHTLSMATNLDKLNTLNAQISTMPGAYQTTALDFTVQPTLMTPTQRIDKGWDIAFRFWGSDRGEVRMVMRSEEDISTMQSYLNEGNIRSWTAYFVEPPPSEAGPGALLSSLAKVDALYTFTKNLGGNALDQQAALSANSVNNNMQNMIGSYERLLGEGNLNNAQISTVQSAIDTAKAIQGEAQSIRALAKEQGANTKVGTLPGLSPRMGTTMEGGVDGGGVSFNFQYMDKYWPTQPEVDERVRKSTAVQAALGITN